MKYLKIVVILLIILLSYSCKKMVDVALPSNQLTPEKVFDNSSSALAATANMYTVLNTVDGNFIAPIGIYTDELITTSVDATSTEFTNSVLTSADSRVLSVWQNLYSAIYKANSIIEGIAPSSLPDSVKNQCVGEAKFMRAYCHFLLINIYGDVPLVTSTDVTKNTNASRTTTNIVYHQITSDLLDAEQLLPSKYITGDKIRANKWAAAALLAKVYLYTKDYSNAETEANAVINSNQYTLLTNLNSVFLVNSGEAILQLWNANGYTTLNSIPASGVPTYQASTSLLNAFEPSDLRKTNWLKSTVVSANTYYYPYKYKQRTTTTGTNAEYSMYLRLAEVYLIRAEARTQLGNNLNGAAADLNLIRNRAGLPNTAASSSSDLLKAIYHERQVEFFNESGNRFFDLKRTGTIDATLSLLKPLWLSTAKLFPIPQSDRLSDPNLSQNPGYSN